MDLTIKFCQDNVIWYKAVYPCRRWNRGHTHHVVRGSNLDEIRATVARRGGQHRVESVPKPSLTAAEIQRRIEEVYGSSPPPMMMLDDLDDLPGHLCKEDVGCCMVQ